MRELTAAERKIFCPECGFVWERHTYIDGTATEPPELECPEYVSELEAEHYRQDEPTHNQFGELGHWVITSGDDIGF